MYTQINNNNNARKKTFTNTFGKLQQVTSLKKLASFQQQKNVRCKTMIQNYDISTENNFKTFQNTNSIAPDMLFGIDEKIKDLQSTILSKKENILITLKLKLQKLMKKYGFSPEEIKLRDLNNELQILEFIIKKFNQKDIQIAQIWNNIQMQKKSYKEDIFQLQKKIIQQTEEIDYLVQKMTNLKYILQVQVKQLDDLNKELQIKQKTNEDLTAEIKQIKIENQTYRKHIDEIQEQQRQCKELLDQIHISYEKKLNDLNKKLDNFKIQNNKLTIQLSDCKLDAQQFQIKYKMIDQQLNKVKREQIRWKQRYQQLRIKLLKSEKYKSTQNQNLTNQFEQNNKQKKENIIKTSQVQTKTATLQEKKQSGDQFGNLLDMHIKLIQQELIESGIIMEKLELGESYR